MSGDIEALRSALDQHSAHLISDAEFRGTVAVRLDHLEKDSNRRKAREWALVLALVVAVMGAAAAYLGG